MAQGDNHRDPKTRQGQHRQELAPNWSTVPIGQNAGKTPAAQNTDTHPFNPAQHGFRPKHSTCTAPSTITADIAAGFSIKKSRLTEQCSSRSIRQLHSTMWTINNCLIVSSTPTYRQQSVAGSTTTCRTDEPKFIFGKKNLKAER